MTGNMSLWSPFDPVTWHAHEMLFGYLGAVMAGYLLTTTPNWTGRLPIVGWPLAGLAALWAVGRIAIAVGAGLGPPLIAVLDLAFPVVLAAVIGREFLAGKTTRNLGVLMLLVLFVLANGLFHLQAANGYPAAAGGGLRMGLAGAVMMISVIGGRMVPSVTRSWLVKNGALVRPAAFGAFDKFTLLITLLALALWVLWPDDLVSALFCGFAGVLGLVRLGRWSGVHIMSDPLMWGLHAGFLFVPLGFLAVAASIWEAGVIPLISAQHLWMAGAIGGMTLAVMARTSLGHSRRGLGAPRGMGMVFGCVISSVVLRFIAGIGDITEWFLYASAATWIMGFAGFAVIYGLILTKRPA